MATRSRITGAVTALSRFRRALGWTPPYVSETRASAKKYPKTERVQPFVELITSFCLVAAVRFRRRGVLWAVRGLGDRIARADEGRHSRSAAKRDRTWASGGLPPTRAPPTIRRSSRASRPAGTLSSWRPTRSLNGFERRKTCLRPGALTF